MSFLQLFLTFLFTQNIIHYRKKLRRKLNKEIPRMKSATMKWLVYFYWEWMKWVIGKQPLRSDNGIIRNLMEVLLRTTYAKGTKFLRDEETKEIFSSNCEETK